MRVPVCSLTTRQTRLERSTEGGDWVNRDVGGREIMGRECRDGREAGEIAKATMRAAACGVAGEGGVDVAIGEDQVGALKQRHDLALAAGGKIGGVQKREGR